MEQSPGTLSALAEALCEAYDGVTVEIHDDGTAMTPMMSVRVDSAKTRAAVLRSLYDREDGTITVAAVHDHQIVVRGDR